MDQPKAVRAVIFAAGRGARLGAMRPKPLTQLADGYSFLSRMIHMLSTGSAVADIAVVVGYMREEIIRVFPGMQFVHNDRFESHNNYLSMLVSFRPDDPCDVVFINGDVVCDQAVLDRVLRHPSSCAAVTFRQVGDEEMKFNLNLDGKRIKNISKLIPDGLGEVVGVNKIASGDLQLVRASLEQCPSDAYYEAGLQLAIDRGLQMTPVDISDLRCCEVDFPEDLEHANSMFCPALTVL